MVDLKQCPDGKVRYATIRMSDARIRERDVRKLVLIEPVTEPERTITAMPMMMSTTIMTSKPPDEQSINELSL